MWFNQFTDHTALFQKLNNKDPKSKKVHLTDSDLQQKLEPIPQNDNETLKITATEGLNGAKAIRKTYK